MDKLPAYGSAHYDQSLIVNTVAGQGAEWQRTLDVLRESDNRFRTLAECAPVVVWIQSASTGTTVELRVPASVIAPRS